MKILSEEKRVVQLLQQEIEAVSGGDCRCICTGENAPGWSGGQSMGMVPSVMECVRVCTAAGMNFGVCA